MRRRNKTSRRSGAESEEKYRLRQAERIRDHEMGIEKLGAR